MWYQQADQKDCEWMHDRYREQEERDRREREERRQRREEERREHYEYNRRHADSWPEALQKQMYLFREEASQWPEDDPDFPDDYFAPGADACERALVIWNEVEATKQAEIAELQRQIEAIKESIRGEVADRLEVENDTQGWKHVASAIREEDYNNWLWW